MINRGYTLGRGGMDTAPPLKVEDPDVVRKGLWGRATFCCEVGMITWVPIRPKPFNRKLKTLLSSLYRYSEKAICYGAW
jgi:hypothetical protein